MLERIKLPKAFSSDTLYPILPLVITPQHPDDAASLCDIGSSLPRGWESSESISVEPGTWAVITTLFSGIYPCPEATCQILALTTHFKRDNFVLFLPGATVLACTEWVRKTVGECLTEKFLLSTIGLSGGDDSKSPEFSNVLLAT